jgi:hypothetical protein
LETVFFLLLSRKAGPMQGHRQIDIRGLSAGRIRLTTGSLSGALKTYRQPAAERFHTE